MKRKCKRVVLLFAVGMMLSCMQMPAAALPDVPTDSESIESAFTDAIFLEEVRKLVGKTGGESIYQADVEAITELVVNGYEKKLKIERLDGIEYFTALEKLDCGGNKLSELDLSHNPELKELQCWDNDLAVLDVSHNPKLEVLDCSYNYMTSLDISGLPALR